MPVRLIAALAVSALVAFALSWIPKDAWTTRQQADIPTLRPAAPVSLREQNLVDLFTSVPSHYNIKRVTWDKGDLSVDFRLAPKERVDADVLYREWYGLTHRVLTRTDNVHTLSLRLWEDLGEDKSRLLLTWVAARPEGWTLPSPGQVDDVKTFAEQKFTVRAAPDFFRKLRPPS